MIDEMEGLSSSDKAKLVRHLNDMADSLPEHPTPAEASRIVKGALKSLEIKVGKKEKDEEPKEEKPKKEKKEDKKEAVKESVGVAKKTFKAFLMELNSGEYDKNLSAKAAMKIQALLDTRFRGYFDHSINKDGSVTFKQNGGTHEHDAGNEYVLSPQNLTKLIGPVMDKFRKLGWTFTQPAMKEFIIGVPEGANLSNASDVLKEGIAGKQPVPLKDIIKIVYDSTMPMHVVDVLQDAAKKKGIAKHQPLDKQRLKELCHAAGLKQNDTEEVLELVGFYD